MKLLAQSDVEKAIGTINAPAGMNEFQNDPVGGLGKLLSTGIQIFFLVASLALLVYLLWGAYDWLTSGGEKEKLTKAQLKIVNAIVGMLLMVFAIVVFNVIMNNVLGGKFIGPGFTFTIPTVNSP
ncbi:hypothetical protein COY87_01185 [Candidatus Roizmanbacteria bacterium CG_4_10_14_0_8_um_filter_33_9]|uniref:Integral membrane protein n=1 Tax=Candidatus Roizmanbacteria bacterium CG_4_10_14_0_8_um_filter_33_9 TaxID=1974826 RepID=A0A2M7QJ74_9BACT|nr:MAG: hypothetical protein COY87_01185 [Candidatus Roizmanbacteria bacterium CG_4_10_14_0_8_um_filter_33_9]